MKYLIHILFISLLASCVTTGSVRYPNKPPEFIVSESAKPTTGKFSVIIRTSDFNSLDATRKDESAWAYFKIEKELIKNGVIVRDRGFFNQSLNQNKDVAYDQMQRATNTDYVIETFFKRDNDLYNLPYFYSGRMKRQSPYPFITDGFSLEFKVIDIKTNEIIGGYKYYYNPCPEHNGCKRTFFVKSGNSFQMPLYLDYDELNTFIATSTSEFVKNFTTQKQ